MTASIRPAAPTHDCIALIGFVTGGLGLVLVVAGTFLPWLASGEVLRNSYQVTGVAARLAIGGQGPVTAALRWWPLVGPLYFLPLLLALLHCRRAAGIVALLLGLLAALLGVTTLVVASGRSSSGVGVVATGPVVLAIGGVLYAAAGGLFTVRPWRRRTVA